MVTVNDPGGPGTSIAPGSGRCMVVGAPKNCNTTAIDPEVKATAPVNDVPTGVVAGGAGGRMTSRHPGRLACVVAVTVAVTAPESVSEPFGVPGSLDVWSCAAVPAPQDEAASPKRTMQIPRRRAAGLITESAYGGCNLSEGGATIY
jgi:hypothetical protein